MLYISGIESVSGSGFPTSVSHTTSKYTNGFFHTRNHNTRPRHRPRPRANGKDKQRKTLVCSTLHSHHRVTPRCRAVQKQVSTATPRAAAASRSTHARTAPHLTALLLPRRPVVDRYTHPAHRRSHTAIRRAAAPREAPSRTAPAPRARHTDIFPSRRTRPGSARNRCVRPSRGRGACVPHPNHSRLGMPDGGAAHCRRCSASRCAAAAAATPLHPSPPPPPSCRRRRRCQRMRARSGCSSPHTTTYSIERPAPQPASPRHRHRHTAARAGCYRAGAVGMRSARRPLTAPARS